MISGMELAVSTERVGLRGTVSPTATVRWQDTTATRSDVCATRPPGAANEDLQSDEQRSGKLCGRRLGLWGGAPPTDNNKLANTANSEHHGVC